MGVRIENPIDAPLNWEQRFTIWLARREWLAFAIIIAVATLAMLPIFVWGFPRGSDADLHHRWANFFTESLREGVLYPHWLAGANRGHGSPVMNYYGPVPLYAVAAFNLFLDNTLHAMTLSCWLAMAISGMTMYVCARSLLSRATSLFAAALYMVTAFHLFDLYQAAALNEYWTFAWLPLVFDAIHRLARGEGWRAAAYLGLSYGLLLLTHVPVPFAATLVLPVYVLMLTRDKRRLLQVAAGLALGVCISAMFIVPVLFERKYVKIDAALGRNYKDFFLFRKTGPLWNVNLFSPSQEMYNGNYLLEATLVALALAVVLITSTLPLWSARKADQPNRSPLAWRRAIWVVAAFSLMMTTRRSAFIWSAFPPLAYLQFPNRWLVITTAATALVAAAALAAITQANRRRLPYGVAFAVALSFNLVISVHQMTQAMYDPEGIARALHGREIPMYTPVWRNDDYKEETVALPAEVRSGDADVQAIDDSGSRQSYAVTARTTAVMGFRQLYFPGWVARVDGQPIPLGPSKAGNIELTIEPGAHQLTLRFEDTPPRTAGKVISATSFIAFLTLLYFTRRRP